MHYQKKSYIYTATTNSTCVRKVGCKQHSLLFKVPRVKGYLRWHWERDRDSCSVFASRIFKYTIYRLFIFFFQILFWVGTCIKFIHSLFLVRLLSRQTIILCMHTAFDPTTGGIHLECNFNKVTPPHAVTLRFWQMDTPIIKTRQNTLITNIMRKTSFFFFNYILLHVWLFSFFFFF